MSRGLGKVERKILEFLNDEQITKDMGIEYRFVSDIVEYVYGIVCPHYGKNGDPPDDTEFLDLIKRDGARYQSVCRALRRLEHPPKHRKKLIIVTNQTFMTYRCYTPNHGKNRANSNKEASDSSRFVQTHQTS